MIHGSRRRDGDRQVQISHNFLTNLVRRDRTQTSMLHNRWTMTCEYGLQRTGRTLSIDLPIRRLGGSSPSERAQLNGHLAPRRRYRCSGCVPPSSAYQWPSRGHRVKDAYGVACDRFATRDRRPLTRDSRHEEDGQGIGTET